jgi:hypothetical protein
MLGFGYGYGYRTWKAFEDEGYREKWFAEERSDCDGGRAAVELQGG